MEDLTPQVTKRETVERKDDFKYLRKEATIFFFDLDGTMGETHENAGFESMKMATLRMFSNDFRDCHFNTGIIYRGRTPAEIERAMDIAFRESTGQTDLLYLYTLLRELGITLEHPELQLHQIVKHFGVRRIVAARDDFNIESNPHPDAIALIDWIQHQRENGVHISAGICTGNSAPESQWLTFADNKLPPKVFGLFQQLSPMPSWHHATSRQRLLLSGDSDYLIYPRIRFATEPLTKATMINCWFEDVVTQYRLDQRPLGVHIDDNPRAFDGFKHLSNGVGIWVQRVPGDEAMLENRHNIIIVPDLYPATVAGSIQAEFENGNLDKTIYDQLSALFPNTTSDNLVNI